MLDFTLMTYKAQILEALGGLMKIKSVKDVPQVNMPYGKGVFDALLFMLNLAEKLDFDSVNMFSHLGYVEYGEGDEVFAILTHLDVVPAGDNWTVEPFACTVKDGKIYGRGAVDNKGAAVVSLFALNAIRENCKTLNKRVRLIFGCDEESGWSDIDFYKKSGMGEPEMAISPDANFPVINTEKGLLQLSIKNALELAPLDGLVLISLRGGDRVNVVPNYAECTLWGNTELVKQAVELYNESAEYKLKTEAGRGEGETVIFSFGLSSHGARPQKGYNALSYLIAFLSTLPLKNNGLSRMAYTLGDAVNIDCDGARMKIASEDYSGKLTLNLGAIKMAGGYIEALVDIRYPVSVDKNQILQKIRDAFDGFEVEEKFSLPAHCVPEDSKLVQTLLEAYQEVTDEKGECISMGGATYARVFKNSVAFGPVFPGQTGTEHQPDEYIEIDSLLKAGDIIANAIIKLCT